MSASPLPSIDASTLEHWLATARRAADAAAEVHARWAKRIDVRSADSKSFSDFVSRVDVEAQDAALEVIGGAHPDHRVMAEEGEDAGVEIPPDGPPLWVVDPLDGTTNFLHDHPNHCASVGLAVDGHLVAGCVSCAPTGERWWARLGGGAFRNGRPIGCSPIREVEGALVATGFVFRDDNPVERFAREIAIVRTAGAGIRRGGAAAIDLCYVADGRFEAYWEHVLSPWDFAAGTVIVREAGGVVERVDASPVTVSQGSILAVNSDRFGASLRALLRE